jgi:hypothetical protein
LRRLPCKTVDEGLLKAEGGSAECTICIDDLVLGETVMTLPCKHWFHETCATMWLKEHNTCPICRSSVELRQPNSEPQSRPDTRASNSEPPRHNSPRDGTRDGIRDEDGRRSRAIDEGTSSNSNSRSGRNLLFSGPPWGGFRAGSRGGGGSATAASASPMPSPNSRHYPLHDAFSSEPSTPFPDSHRGVPPLSRTDTGVSERSRSSAFVTTEQNSSLRSSRRDSRSPTSLDPNRPTRRRSPQQSASASRDQAEGAGSSNHNPLNWLRHAMDRGSGSSGSSRDGNNSRRYY